MTAFTDCRASTTKGRPPLRSHRAVKRALNFVLGATLVGAVTAPRAVMAEGSDPKFKPVEKIGDDRVDMFMYGRMGTGWTPSGQVIAGAYMNLGDRKAIGGRLEEGDYLEPGLRYHILQGTSETDTMVDLVMDVEMWSNDGAMLSDIASGALGDLKIFPLQAYVQAHNVLVPDLDIWMGARLYRKQDIHIADYFYFNSLPSQGTGVMYKGLDAAVLVTTGDSSFYQHDVTTINTMGQDPTKTARRLRTMFVAQYKQPIPLRGSFVQGLGEFHVVPKLAKGDIDAPANFDPSDTGWVLGAKLHLDLGGENFNSTSIRYGAGIANGAASGRSTYDTFGSPNAEGKYKGAGGVEFVEHFGVQFGQVAAINGYGTVHWDKGARGDQTATDPTPDTRLDYTVGVRPEFYIHPQFHLFAEATYQSRKDQGRDEGTAVKLAIVPTIVPGGKDGEASIWTRPHYRLIYQFGHYNDAAVAQLMSPYLRTVGPNHNAHYLGARVEWWFY